MKFEKPKKKPKASVVQTSRIASAGIARYFKGIFLSQQLGADKPQAEFFERATGQIEGYSPEESIILGDSLTSDIQGGINAGIFVDDNGAGLEISSDVKFSASALPFHWKELDVRMLGNNQAHSLELKKAAYEGQRSLGKTWVNFDLVQMGLGCVNSWGAWPRMEHLVIPQEYTFRFILRPVNN